MKKSVIKYSKKNELSLIKENNPFGNNLKKLLEKNLKSIIFNLSVEGDKYDFDLNL